MPDWLRQRPLNTITSTRPLTNGAKQQRTEPKGSARRARAGGHAAGEGAPLVESPLRGHGLRVHDGDRHGLGVRLVAANVRCGHPRWGGLHGAGRWRLRHGRRVGLLVFPGSLVSVVVVVAVLVPLVGKTVDCRAAAVTAVVGVVMIVRHLEYCGLTGWLAGLGES